MIVMMARIDRDDTAIMNHSGRIENKEKFNRSEGVIAERLTPKV